VIESELKARVRDPAALAGRLRHLASGEPSLYRDTYYDRPGGDLTAQGQELRVRVIETGSMRRAVLTYKEPPADAASGSKPEHETVIADPGVADTILLALGMEHLVTFEKHCTNYRLTAHGRDLLATVVTVPEIDGTFLEVETLAGETELAGALTDVRAVLHDLGIPDEDLTTEQYTDAVLRARRSHTT